MLGELRLDPGMSIKVTVDAGVKVLKVWRNMVGVCEIGTASPVANL